MDTEKQVFPDVTSSANVSNERILFSSIPLVNYTDSKKKNPLWVAGWATSAASVQAFDIIGVKHLFWAGVTIMVLRGMDDCVRYNQEEYHQP